MEVGLARQVFTVSFVVAVAVAWGIASRSIWQALIVLLGFPVLAFIRRRLWGF